MKISNHLKASSIAFLVFLAIAFAILRSNCTGAFGPECAVGIIAGLFFTLYVFVLYLFVSTVFFFISKRKKWKWNRTYLFSIIATFLIILLVIIVGPPLFRLSKQIKFSSIQKNACENANEENIYINSDGDKEVFNCKNSKFHGSYKAYYASGSLAKETTYLNGKQDGTFINFYENGNLKSFSERLQDNSINSGLYVTGDEKGMINYVSYYKIPDDLKPDLIFDRPYFDKSQRISLESQEIICKKQEVESKVFTCSEGVFDGLYRGYRKGKNNTRLLYIESNYSDGKLNGVSKKYHAYDGYLEMVANYNNDKLEGDYTEYDRNGNIVKTYQFSNGNPLLTEFEKFPILMSLIER